MGQAQGKDQLPVDVGDIHSCMIGKTIWSVHSGKRKDSDEQVTVFVFNFANKSDDEIRLARSTHHRLKTLRHPNVLKYIDGIELPDSIYMMTEEATPLQTYLESMDHGSDHLIRWGLHQIMKSLAFLTIDCGLIHNNVCLSSIFVDAAGEWKLGGVEFIYPYTDTTAPIKLLDSLKRYDPPERNKPAAARKGEKWSVDMWGLGCLIWEVYNGPLPQSTALKTTNKIPKSLLTHYYELVSGNPRTRPSPNVLLHTFKEQGGYLDNQFVSLNLRLEEIQIMEHSQKNRFFGELDKSLHLFTDRFQHYKILPHLLNAFEFGGAGSAVLAPMLKIGRLLDTEEYQRKIVPCIVRLFNSNDRATRLNLLQQLEHFMDHLEPGVVNNQIFPPLTSGFTDTEAIIREHTVKAMLLVAPKLNDSNMNTQLLKFFAKCQMDEKASIRTNTTVCLGKIASYLNPKTREKILISAFARSLKDPFPPARIAGITGFASTNEYYSPGDVASKILPALCLITMDKEKSVREQTFKVIRMFLNALEKHSETLPVSAEINQSAVGTGSSGGAAGWTGWAMSSFTKLYGSKTTTEGEDKKPAGPVTQTGDAPTPPTHGHTSNEKPSGVPQNPTGRTDNNTGPSVGMKSSSEGWDDDNWEDDEFESLSKPSKEDQSSGAVGWGDDDDNWDDFEDTAPSQAPPPHPSSSTQSHKTSSHMKLGGVKKPLTEEVDDFWTKMGANQSTSRVKEKTPPPPVPAGLFGGNGASEGGDGWGDWNDDPLGIEGSQEYTTTMKESATVNTSTDDGWGFDDGGWGSMDTSSKKKDEEEDKKAAISRKEENERRREERRLKQQAARERQQKARANKPSSGLGAVKKD